MNAETKEWRLSIYRCFRETEVSTPDQPTLPTTSDTAVRETEVAPNGVWHTRRDHTAAALILRISSFGHLTILQGSEVVESYFLILAKKWIKAVNIDDEIMLYIRERSRVRRLRLTFANAAEAQSCYEELGKHVSVKQCPQSDPARSPATNDDEAVSRWLDTMTGGAASSRCLAADAAWRTEWPTDKLTELVKLCLLDPNFPGFVRQVQEAIQLLTLDVDSETQNDVEE
uniref:Uncharacterized protein n=1 Tax=Mesocestoides corti TaxID=53468 RepID=A0A5K3FFN7_MESCO